MRLFFLILLLASCASQPVSHLYSIDVPDGVRDAGLVPETISVSMPTAHPGYDTAMMAYQVRPHEIDYFSRNSWIDTPGRMLYPALIEALSKRFSAAVKAPARADVRLDTDIVLFRQEFSGNSSRIHIVLRIMIDRNGKVASKTFEAFEPCPSNDPYGGAIAANQAVSRLMREISEFSVSQSSTPRPDRKG